MCEIYIFQILPPTYYWVSSSNNTCESLYCSSNARVHNYLHQKHNVACIAIESIDIQYKCFGRRIYLKQDQIIYVHRHHCHYSSIIDDFKHFVKRMTVTKPNLFCIFWSDSWLLVLYLLRFQNTLKIMIKDNSECFTLNL